ncbi:MAG TPA: TolC family protein, partial [Burkholderiaceae bacterium]|nr:TolC family protein [Burkholderiaceae bacterium]
MSLLLVAAAPIRAAAPPLSLGDALEIATRDARSLSASAAAAESARQMARAAKQLPDPVLRAGIDNLPIEGPDRFALGRESMTMRRIGVMQEYVSADKRAARQQRVEREADRADALGAALRAELRADVAAAWIDRIYAQRAERQLAALADELAMQQRTLQAQLAAGRAAAADVLAADAMNALTRDRAVAAGQQTAIATARLARWIGAHAQRPFADEALGGGAADAARAADYAIETHPQLRALQAEIEAAQSALRLAILDRQPNWSWEVAFAQRGSGFSNMVSFGVSVPLPIARGERQDREVAARAAQLDQAQQQ